MALPAIPLELPNPETCSIVSTGSVHIPVLPKPGAGLPERIGVQLDGTAIAVLAVSDLEEQELPGMRRSGVRFGWLRGYRFLRHAAISRQCPP